MSRPAGEWPVLSGNDYRLTPDTAFKAAPQKSGSSAFSHLVCLSIAALVKQHSFFLQNWGSPWFYFGHLMQRTDSFEKTLRLGKIEGRRRKG